MLRVCYSMFIIVCKSFWHEVRRVSKTNATNACEINGVQGDDEICDMFCDKYQALYTSVTFDQTTMDNITHTVEQRMRDNCNTSECSVSHDISVTDVINAVNKMKLFKSDANFELYSNNLIHGCQLLYLVNYLTS